MEFCWTELDTWIVITGTLSAISCALVGNFMILRRLSMMGDAISHAVLPGIAIAFLLTGSRDSMTMFIGAAITGIMTAVFTQSIHKFGNVEESAAMGVVFTTLFAIGLVLIVYAADSVDLDPGCVLYGAIEFVPLDTRSIMGWDVPRAILPLSITLGINILFITLFFKELKISSFDPQLSTTLGISSSYIHYALMTLVAITAVASFESVGSIVVIAMIITPGAAAYLLTDRLSVMIFLSVIFAALFVALGHLFAITIPQIWGFSDTNTVGMIGVVSGFIFFIVVLISPRYGLISQGIRRFKLAIEITCDDVLGLLFRAKERQLAVKSANIRRLLQRYTGRSYLLYLCTILLLQKRKEVISQGKDLQLTDKGNQKAQSIIRSHRLWEAYLFTYSNTSADHLHFPAETLEHITDPVMQQELASETDSPAKDPHGKKIP